jgi:hypothetical protein
MSQTIKAAGHWINEPEVFEVLVSTGSWDGTEEDDQFFFYTDGEPIKSGDTLPIDDGFRIIEIYEELQA